MHERVDSDCDIPEVGEKGFTHKSEPSQNPDIKTKIKNNTLSSSRVEESPKTKTKMTTRTKPTVDNIKQEATPCDDTQTAETKRRATSRRGLNRKHASVSPAAPAREFIVDSGACLLCVQRSNLSNAELQTLKTTQSIVLQTANGMVDANQVVQIYVHELKFKLWALILDNTPCLLSMGRLCRQQGFTLTQDGDNPPVLYKDDVRVYCQ